jgi:hypothetical protein
MCSVSSGKDESQSVLYSPCWRRNFHAHRLYYFCWATLHLFLRFICITPLLLARSGCRPFLNEGSMIFPPRCSRSRWWDLTSVRFPVSFYNYTLCSRRWSRCPPMLPLVVSLFLLRGFTLHLILPSGYYFDLRIYECFQFVLRLCHHFHHVYVAT